MDAAPAQLCAHRPADVLRHFSDLLALGGGVGGASGGVKWAPQTLVPVLEAAYRFTGFMTGESGGEELEEEGQGASAASAEVRGVNSVRGTAAGEWKLGALFQA